METRKLESDIQSKIIKYLESQGAYATKVVVATKNGVPDIICCYQGRYIAFEIKRDSQKVDRAGELQKWNIQQIKKAGGVGFIVCSLEEVRSIIETIKVSGNQRQKYNETNKI